MAANATLKMAIFKRTLTQAAVAQRVGMSETKLSRIIHGYYDPTDDEKKAIAKVLRRSIHELFTEVAA